MKELEVEIWLWAETNINWIPKLIQEAEKMGVKLFKILRSSQQPVMTLQNGSNQLEPALDWEGSEEGDVYISI
eukprot:8732152-Ditylum_brightwellii.AAC.1